MAMDREGQSATAFHSSVRQTERIQRRSDAVQLSYDHGVFKCFKSRFGEELSVLSSMFATRVSFAYQCMWLDFAE